jgi:hypothetical protein
MAFLSAAALFAARKPDTTKVKSAPINYRMRSAGLFEEPRCHREFRRGPCVPRAGFPQVGTRSGDWMVVATDR